MKIYYWNVKKNFGDELSGLLIKKFTKLSSEWSVPEEADLVMVGSILEHLSSDYSGIIAGCGKLHEKTKVSFPNAKILALRGPLTARGVKGNFVLADPGLLADELVSLEDREYDLGIVPHWTDKDLEHNKIFKKYNPLIIRPNQDPLEVIRQIGKCKKIVSSSLHGIILADAFGIPRRIEIAPRMQTHPHQEGNLFKFKDYLSSINMPFEFGVTREVDRNTITEKQHELYDVFQEIKGIFS